MTLYRLGYNTVYSVIVTKVIVSDHALLEFFMWVGYIFMVMCSCQANGSYLITGLWTGLLDCTDGVDYWINI